MKKWIVGVAVVFACFGAYVVAAPSTLGQIFLLDKLAFASFPAASATNESGWLYDSTNKFTRYSDGASWAIPGGGVGRWGAACNTTMSCIAGATYSGGFRANQPGGKFRNITCNTLVAGTAGSLTLRIRNLTDATTTCSCSITCNAAITTMQTCDCNGTYTNGKDYVVQVDAATTCATPPTVIGCAVGIEPT